MGEGSFCCQEQEIWRKKVYDCIISDNKQQGEKCLGRNLKEFEEIEAENFK